VEHRSVIDFTRAATGPQEYSKLYPFWWDTFGSDVLTATQVIGDDEYED
jgi:hypothetical protein